MKKILFSVYCKTFAQKDIAHALLHTISLGDYQVDVIANQKLNKESGYRQVHFSTNDLANDYDAIFAYNRKGYNRIKNYSKKSNIPIFYIVNKYDCISEYVYDLTSIRRYIVINDGGEFDYSLFPMEYTLHIPYPFLPVKNLPTKSTKSDKTITVCTDDETLFKIISVLNCHSDFNFTVICRLSKEIKKISNSNIKVVSTNDSTPIDTFIYQADMVIGSGLAVLKSLYYQTPVVIVGEYGFGRLLTTENIELQFNSFFKGRIGGQKNEVIPYHLLSYEITTFFKQSNTEYLNMFNLISYNLENSIFKLLADLGQPTKDIFTLNLKLTSLYYYIRMTEKEYIVTDSKTYTFHAIMETDEYDWLQLFREGTTPEKIFLHIKNMNKQSFIEYIEFLIAHKFLIPYDETTNFET